jgi:hypothetical protein
MEDEQRRTAKRQMMGLMQAGTSWQEAAQLAGVQVSRWAAYRWLASYRTQGAPALLDGQGVSLFDVCTSRMRHNRIASIAAKVRAKLLPDCYHEASSPEDNT